MRLSIEKRLRVISIYEKNELFFSKNRFEKLRQLAKAENITIGLLGSRNLIKKWLSLGYIIL